jgi:hypothetical protein
MSAAYNSEDCQLLANALEQAWELFLQNGGLTFENADTAQASLTYAILDTASKGERNPRRLAFAAVARVPEFEPEIRKRRSCWSRK